MKSISKNIKTITFLFIIAVVSGTSVFAQCKSAIQDGIIKLDPYNFDGQINSPTVKAGKPAEVHLTFYRGRSYKLQINPEAEYAAKVNFRVLDANKKEIYNSATGSQTNSWTFYSNSAQELIIEVVSTEKSKHCVAVLVGVQMPKINSSSMRDL